MEGLEAGGCDAAGRAAGLAGVAGVAAGAGVADCAAGLCVSVLPGKTGTNACGHIGKAGVGGGSVAITEGSTPLSRDSCACAASAARSSGERPSENTSNK